MENSNYIDNNNNENYQQEKKLQYQLKDELIFITQNSLQNSINVFDSFIDKLINYYSNKRLPLIKEYCKNNLIEEEYKDREEQENKKIEEIRNNLKKLIKNDLEKSSNENTKDLISKIDEILDTSNLNRNIKKIYNQIKNNEFNSKKLDERLNETYTKFEDTFRIYLLKKMKYKEELEIYKSRKEQIINENIDTRKDYNDINNYLNNFQINVKSNNDYEKLKNIVQQVGEFNIKQIKDK